MRDSWLKLVQSVLRPARPHLARCLRERERHFSDRRLWAKRRAQALADCEARIEVARAAVFEASDGIVTSRMGELERRWRLLCRPDPDGGLMDLWARTVPDSWLDRKRWRDSEAAAQVDVAVALASDAEGVEAAEAAIGSLRVELAAWGVPIGSRIRWRAFDNDAAVVPGLFADPLRAATEALSARGTWSVAFERAQDLEQCVQEAAENRFSERRLLVRDLAHAAFVDSLLHAASLARPNPVTPLRELWTAGYALAAADAEGVTIELPPL